MAEFNVTQPYENDGISHISNLENYEPARSNYFTLLIDNIEGLVRSDFNGSEVNEGTDVIKGGQSALKLAVNKASVPHFAINPIEIRRGNSVVKFAGNPQFPEGSIEVEDFVGLHVKDILMAWQAQAYDVVNDRGGRAVDYKKRCVLQERTQDYTLVREWEIIGAWISDITEDDFDISADGDRKITCKIQYDRAIMHTQLGSK